MREKHALWTAAANGQNVTATTDAKREALERWNIVMLAERFGWTPQEVRALPIDLLNDIYTIMALQDAKAKKPSK